MQPINHDNRGAAIAPHYIEKAAMLVMLLVVFALWGGKTQHYGHAFMVIIGAVFLLSLAMPSKWMAAFGAYLSVWCAWMYSSAFSGLYFIELASQLSDTVLFIIAGAVFFIFVCYGTASTGFYKNWICGFSLALSLIAILQYYHFNLRVVGTLGNENFLAAFVAISLPLFVRRKWLYAIPLIILTLILARTSTAFVAAMAGVIFYLWPTIKRMNEGLLIALAMAVSIALLSYTFIYHPSILGSDRYMMWLDAAKVISLHWHTFIFGVGPGVLWLAGDMLHSEYAYMYFNFGTLGLVILFGIMKSIPNSDRALYASAIVIAVNMVGNHLFHTGPTAIEATIIIALLFKEG